jgi:hypothetical protein
MAQASGNVSDTGARIALAAIIAELGSQEVAVLTLLAKRLQLGQRAYGLIDVASDPRDYDAERGEELADALVYTGMAELRRLVTRAGGV